MSIGGPHPEAPALRASKDEDPSAKPALRKALAARRAKLHAERGWWAAEVATALYPAISGPGVVAGYWPMRSEIDPRPLMRRFARAGWRIALPVTPARSIDGPLEFRLWDPAEPLVAHAFGMQEPAAGAPSLRPDVVITPMLGFDTRGHRLGYGAGHYDRTLAALRASGSVHALGLGFSGQGVDALPTHGRDQPLDAVLTEAGLVRFAPPA